MPSNQKSRQNEDLNWDQTISTEGRPIQPTTGARGMGWLPDRPDFRDYHEGTSEIRGILDSEERLEREIKKRPSLDKALTIPPLSRRVKADSLPTSVDLRDYCSPVEDQGQLGSCTAHAGVGLIEYYERRAFGRHLDASRLFLYKATRNLMKMRGDTD